MSCLFASIWLVNKQTVWHRLQKQLIYFIVCWLLETWLKSAIFYGTELSDKTKILIPYLAGYSISIHMLKISYWWASVFYPKLIVQGSGASHPQQLWSCQKLSFKLQTKVFWVTFNKRFSLNLFLNFISCQMFIQKNVFLDI